MKFAVTRFVVMPLVAVALVGCGDASSNVDAHREAVGAAGVLRFEVDSDGALSQGTNDLRISIRDVATNAPFTGAEVELSAIMPAMAHDAPDAPAIDELGAGTYFARDVALSMPGRWQIHVNAARAESHDEADFVYDIP
jgi:hypothetical protein